MTNVAFNVEGGVPINANVQRRVVRDINSSDEQNGSVPAAIASTTVATEHGNRVVHRTVITCTATPIAISDDAGVAQYGGVKLYDFPEGMLLFFGASIDGSLTLPAPFVDAFGGDVALGTVTATTGATLISTEADYLTSTALTTAVTKVANSDAQSIATALTEAGARWMDGTATAKDLFLNFVIDDNGAHTAETGLFTGVVTIAWMLLGDN